MVDSVTADDDEAQGPIRVALVNDYDVVVLGLARILERTTDRLVIAEIDTNQAVVDVSTWSCTTPSPSPSPTGGDRRAGRQPPGRCR